MKLLFDGGVTFAGEMGHEVSSKCDEEGPPVIIGIKVYNIRYEMANKVVVSFFETTVSCSQLKTRAYDQKLTMQLHQQCTHHWYPLSLLKFSSSALCPFLTRGSFSFTMVALFFSMFGRNLCVDDRHTIQPQCEQKVRKKRILWNLPLI